MRDRDFARAECSRVYVFKNKEILVFFFYCACALHLPQFDLYAKYKSDEGYTPDEPRDEHENSIRLMQLLRLKSYETYICIIANIKKISEPSINNFSGYKNVNFNLILIYTKLCKPLLSSFENIHDFYKQKRRIVMFTNNKLDY